MTDQPKWLTDALNAHRPSALDLVTSDKADLCPGDLWVFESGPGVAPERRVVLILDTDGAQVHAALVTNEVDLATRDDVVLPGAEAGTAFAMAVETLLHARLWWRNAVGRVGALTSERLDQILDLMWGEPTPDLDVLRGSARSDNPSVTEFQRDELDALRRLASTSDPRFGEVAVPVCVVDPAVLLEPGLDLKAASEVAHTAASDSTVFCYGLVASHVSARSGERGVLDPALGALLAYTTGRLMSQQPSARRVVDHEGGRSVVTSFGGAWLESVCALSVSLRGHDRDQHEPFAFLEGVPVISARRA